MEKYGQDKERETKVREGTQDGEPERDPRGLGFTERKSPITGDDEIGLSGGSSDEGVEERTIGGILRQLKLSMEEHLAYVNAHTERLKARLAEDEEQRSKILNEMAAIEEEIKQLESVEEEQN